MEARIAAIVPDTRAEGPGRRFAVWFQGCPLRCPGCCNPEYLPFEGGTMMSVESIVERLTIANKDGVEGLSLLGGEPFAHLDEAMALASAARTLHMGVMIYTGYTIEELRLRSGDHSDRLIALTDLLVDGRYDRDRPERRRRWIGSSNQQIHFLTDRYSPSDPCWHMPNTLEIRLLGNDVMVNGFPAAEAKGLWKGWKRRTVNRD
jgi:anaerobic ribonucleoside-triphosphate reductase activating protein